MNTAAHTNDGMHRYPPNFRYAKINTEEEK